MRRKRSHVHVFEVYGDHGPEDYGDPLAEWCPGCGLLRDSIERPMSDEMLAAVANVQRGVSRSRAARGER